MLDDDISSRDEESEPLPEDPEDDMLASSLSFLFGGALLSSELDSLSELPLLLLEDELLELPLLSLF